MSSASIGSGSHSSGALRIRSWYQRSRPSVNSTVNGLLVRRCTTMTCSIDGVACERFVGDALQLHDVAAAIAAVGRDEQPRLLVVDAVAQRLGAEAAEDHAVHGADARAGQHRDGQLGDERQVDRDAIALPDAERLEHVGELADLAIELPVGDGAAIAGLAFPDDRGLVAPPAADVPVQAVDAGVQLAADEPLRVRRLPVEHLGPRRASTRARRQTSPRTPPGRVRPLRRSSGRARARPRQTPAADRSGGPPGGARRSGRWSCRRP